MRPFNNFFNLDLNNKIFGVNKPKFFSSNQIIQIIKKQHNLKKIGHAGTLDPLATGLLLVATNSKTKELNNLILKNKKYVAEIKFNYQTTTYDTEGSITNTTFLKIQKSLLEQEIKSYKNTIWYQKPPIFSAVKVKGKKLYQYALQHKDIKIPIKKVVINDIKLLNFDYVNQTALIWMDVSKGFYIRSFANDLGLRLNNFAYLKNLTRISVGDYLLEDAYDFYDLIDNSKHL